MRFRSAPVRWPLVAAGLTILLVFSHVEGHAAQEAPPHSADLDEMIVEAAKRHGIPETLVRRVVMRESRYNPHARNHHFWGLMQISYPTARSMGFKGTPQELLNPLTNLTYAVPYLANAFIAAGRREDAAIRLYASGYYDTARHRGLLGLMRTADSTPLAEVAPAPVAAPPSYGIFGALFGPSSASSDAPQMAQAAPPVLDTASAQPGAAPQAGSGGPSAPSSDAPSSKPVAALAQGKGSGDDTDMVVGKAGNLAPPKKWLHDGGLTVLARGEQGIERTAAGGDRAASQQGTRLVSRRSRKNTEFAALDTPPPSAQAYAAMAGDPQPAPQAAISEAISASTASAASRQPVEQADAPPAASQSVESKASRKHRVKADHKPKAATKPDTSKPVKAVADLQP